MGMLEWAKKEIEISFGKEDPNTEEGDWRYGYECAQSALRAFEILCNDGHSGFSIKVTQEILNRLIDGKPLTAIEDIDDIWNYGFINKRGVKTFQCIRMSSLFKYIYPDGTVKYHDVNRYIAVEVDSPDVGFRNGLIIRIVHEMFPITMPYYPENKPYKVYTKELLTDEKNGDFDTIGVLYLIKPNGERVDINRYFKEEADDMVEIDIKEYSHRKMLSEGLKKRKE